LWRNNADDGAAEVSGAAGHRPSRRPSWTPGSCSGQREVWIEHDGVRYRLRITRRGKLILQK
jgi:hypothetical protein